MDLMTLFRAPEDEIRQALAQDRALSAAVADDARVVVQRDAAGGYLADLQVKGSTVTYVRADDLTRFRQRLKEQIAIHVPRDQQPDLAGS